MNGDRPAHGAANAGWEAVQGTHVVPQERQFRRAGLLRQHHAHQVPRTRKAACQMMRCAEDMSINDRAPTQAVIYVK